MRQFFIFTFIVFAFGNVFSQDVAAIAESDNFQDYRWNVESHVTIPESEPNPLVLEKGNRTCFCIVSNHNLTNAKKRRGVLLDLTGRVNTKFNGMSQKKRNECNRKCTEESRKLSSADYNLMSRKACEQGVPNGSLIRAFSALSTKAYMTADNVGTLTNIPAVTEQQCNCPSGWEVDPNQNDLRKKCNRRVCQTAFPVANTDLPNFGFIWENFIYQVRPANCKTHTVKPGVCHISK